MSSFTFLSEKQVLGIRKLDIFKKYGYKYGVSDFAMLLGAKVNNAYNLDWLTKNIEISRDDNVVWHLISISGYTRISTLNGSGARPVTNYYEIPFEEEKTLNKDSTTRLIEYGEYPQSIADADTSKELEKMYNNKTLKKTGKKYTITNKQSDGLSYDELEEYTYNGKKYVRLVSKHEIMNEELNNQLIKKDQEYWFLVEPIVWLVDLKSNLMITQNILLAGFGKEHAFKENFIGKLVFENTIVKEFLDKYFSKEIIPSKVKSHINSVKELMNSIKIIIRNKPYEFIILNELDILKDNYNKALLNIKNNYDDNSKLSFGIDDSKTVVKKMMIELNDILTKIAEYNKNNVEYFQMLNYLNNIIAIIDKNGNVDKENELMCDISKIIEVPIPYINNSKEMLDKLRMLFEEEKNNLEKYMQDLMIGNNKSDNINYHKQSELESHLRRKIHPYLQELVTMVYGRSIQREINESLLNIVNSNYENAKNSEFSLYLNLINESYNSIYRQLPLLTDNKRDYYKEMINKVLINDINFNQDYQLIINELRIKWSSLNKIMFEVEDYVNEINYIRNSLLK